MTEIEEIYDEYIESGQEWKELISRHREFIVSIINDQRNYVAYRAFLVGEALKYQWGVDELMIYTASRNTKYNYLRCSRCIWDIWMEDKELSRKVFFDTESIFCTKHILELYSLKSISGSRWKDIINDYIAIGGRIKELNNRYYGCDLFEGGKKLSIKNGPRGDPSNSNCKALVYTIESWKTTFCQSVANIDFNNVSSDVYKELSNTMKEFKRIFYIERRK